MELSLGPLQKSLSGFFGRFHFIIFFVLVAAGLMTAIYVLNGAIASSDPSNTTTTSGASTFDQATIDRIRQLRTPDQETRKIQAEGRINPF